jgi:hypothetical protein
MVLNYREYVGFTVELSMNLESGDMSLCHILFCLQEGTPLVEPRLSWTEMLKQNMASFRNHCILPQFNLSLPSSPHALAASSKQRSRGLP